jgi:hypothetical protein
MKKEDIPQDPGALAKVTKELTYAVDESGKYTTELSAGWEIKAKALDVAWDDVEKRIADAKEKVIKGEASPILYFIEYKLMDPGIVAAYTGFWKWQVKRHLKPNVFKKLSDKKLERYSTLFEIPVDQLKHPF